MQQKYITKLNNITFIELKYIIKAEHKYFSKIFSSQNPPALFLSANTEPFSPANRTQLTLEEKALCEGPITEDELPMALHSFKAFKSPGLDGITVELYQTFLSPH